MQESAVPGLRHLSWPVGPATVLAACWRALPSTPFLVPGWSAIWTCSCCCCSGYTFPPFFPLRPAHLVQRVKVVLHALDGHVLAILDALGLEHLGKSALTLLCHKPEETAVAQAQASQPPSCTTCAAQWWRCNCAAHASMPLLQLRACRAVLPTQSVAHLYLCILLLCPLSSSCKDSAGREA